MKTHWATELLNQKALVVLSLSTAISAYIPSKLTPYLDDLFFVILGWIFAMCLTIVEYMVRQNSTAKDRMELFSKMVIYTMIFFALKFFHLWIVFEDHDYFGSIANIIVIFSYMLVTLGEFKLIGNSFALKYGTKPKIFSRLQDLEEWIMKSIVKRAEKTCNLEKPIDESEA